MNLKIGDEIFVKGITNTHAYVRELKCDRTKNCIKIEVDWKDSLGIKMGKSFFFEDQENIEWWKDKKT